jgi:PAS domain S-box-containing protein
MVIVNQQSEIVLVNVQTEQHFGYQREELLGQSVDILLPERLRGKHAGHRASYIADPRTCPMGQALNSTAGAKMAVSFRSRSVSALYRPTRVY